MYQPTNGYGDVTPHARKKSLGVLARLGYAYMIIIFSSFSKDEMKQLLQTHAQKMIQGDRRLMFITRGSDVEVWNQVSEWWRGPGFRGKPSTIKVNFLSDEGIDEDAIDLGGPRREFFRILLRSIVTSSKVFTGE